MVKGTLLDSGVKKEVSKKIFDHFGKEEVVYHF